MNRGWPKGRKHTSEEKMKISLKLKGRIPWNLGLTKATDKRLAMLGQKLSLIQKGHPLYGGMTGKHHSIETIHKISESNLGKSHCNKGVPFTDEHRRNIGVVVRKRFDDPKYLKKIMRRRIPSYPEQLFSDLCKEFKYVGDGSLMIDGKNPDFVDSTGTKLIEIWGEHWHRNQDPQDRIDFFKIRGYDCLIVKPFELKELDKLREKVKEFENE